MVRREQQRQSEPAAHPASFLVATSVDAAWSQAAILQSEAALSLISQMWLVNTGRHSKILLLQDS